MKFSSPNKLRRFCLNESINILPDIYLIFLKMDFKLNTANEPISP